MGSGLSHTEDHAKKMVSFLWIPMRMLCETWPRAASARWCQKQERPPLGHLRRSVRNTEGARIRKRREFHSVSERYASSHGARPNKSTSEPDEARRLRSLTVNHLDRRLSVRRWGFAVLPPLQSQQLVAPVGGSNVTRSGKRSQHAVCTTSGWAAGG